MKKKKIVTTPFDRYRMPPKQNLFFVPLIWLVCLFMTCGSRLKIRRTRMKGLKPPYLVLATHQAFMDFYVAPLALFPHRANYISELEGFENFGEWIYRRIGCLGTRKFVDDLALIRNIKRVVERKGVLVLFPEARYANAGTSSRLLYTVGKLAKMLGVPVVVLNMHGNYLQSPIWNLKKRKGVRLEAEITQLFTKEELAAASLPQIMNAFREHLQYDEYAWQLQKDMRISFPNRAEGLELVLYKCPDCGREFRMKAVGAELCCPDCEGRWHMTELGRLERISGANADAGFTHIPDWYEWEREQAAREIDRDEYALAVRVKIESLPNAVNFIDLGEGFLRHGRDGFALTFKDCGEDTEQTLVVAPAKAPSVHTEYDYRGKGPCITLSTLDNTYFLFPMEDGFNVTKIQFAAEYLHDKATKR
ncbi:MAG: hypothetical protein LBS85_01770 [Clostridiales Family XIII bacterium]|jgi:1-acyl-sn-glycerol-3-phosphate acyltransferase|nr:hypothetical protein [Clostridiales Family XIII bacterium]